MLDHQIGGGMIFLRLKVLKSIHLWSESDDLWSNSYLPNSSSCIDLIFTNQPNLVTESGVYPSLLLKCHYQIVFAKLNLNVEYPPLYERLIWDYKNVNIPSINRANNIFDWGNSFEGNVKSQTDYERLHLIINSLIKTIRSSK